MSPSFSFSHNFRLSARPPRLSGTDVPPQRNAGLQEQVPMVAPQGSSFCVVVSRVTWMFFGPMFLLVAAAAVATKSKGPFGFTDLVYLVMFGAMVAARWVEFRCGNPRTATGEPATRQHLHRYTFVASVAAVAPWGIA